MHNSSLVAIAQYFGPIRTSVLYGNWKKINTEAVNDYPPIRFEIRFERKFPIVGLYFLTLPVETLRNLCQVEKLFGMRMACLCQFYWRTCLFLFVRSTISRQPVGRFTPKFACRRTLVPDVSSPLLGVGGPRRAEKGANRIWCTLALKSVIWWQQF